MKTNRFNFEITSKRISNFENYDDNKPKNYLKKNWQKYVKSNNKKTIKKCQIDEI